VSPNAADGRSILWLYADAEARGLLVEASSTSFGEAATIQAWNMTNGLKLNVSALGTTDWAINSSGHLVATEARNVILGTVTGTKIGTATTQKLGFWNSAPVVQSAVAALTNNVAVGGTNDVLDNYTDLTTYATDAAAIRNNLYQLGRKVAQVTDALRLYGLLG
jgi:hypothetical protein